MDMCQIEVIIKAKTKFVYLVFGKQPKSVKYFSSKNRFSIFSAIHTTSFLKPEHVLSYLITIFTWIILSLPTLCTVEDKPVVSMTEPFRLCTSC